MDNLGLLQHISNTYSQAGQDGIIAHIFKTLGLTNGLFVEFGAWDGVHLSNCKKLHDEGWPGIFIEADPQKFKTLQKNYQGAERVKCVNRKVEPSGPDRFDSIMSDCALEQPITFLSIDIDGLDLEVFESIDKHLPLVACIEGGKGAHPYEPRVAKNQLYNVGQSLSVINEVAEQKGYKILCSYQDTFLIREEYISKFDCTTDLFDLYIAGYLAQSPKHIPMFAERLRKNGRKNQILDYVLESTDYREYPNAIKWKSENKDLILDTLKNLPEHVRVLNSNYGKNIFSRAISNILMR